MFNLGKLINRLIKERTTVKTNALVEEETGATEVFRPNTIASTVNSKSLSVEIHNKGELTKMIISGEGGVSDYLNAIDNDPNLTPEEKAKYRKISVSTLGGNMHSVNEGNYYFISIEGISYVVFDNDKKSRLDEFAPEEDEIIERSIKVNKDNENKITFAFSISHHDTNGSTGEVKKYESKFLTMDNPPSGYYYLTYDEAKEGIDILIDRFSKVIPLDDGLEVFVDINKQVSELINTRTFKS